jgi:hypothetical protein
MLPGFRFLFAAIVLSLSVLIFGLGAAALLRAAHEEFASMPSRRAPPEMVFAQQSEPPAPTLALLRFDPPVAEEAPDIVPMAAAPAEQAPDATPPAEPEKLAALKPEDVSAPEAAKPEGSKPEASNPEASNSETSKPETSNLETSKPEDSVPETTSAIPPAQAEAPASVDESKPAAVAETPAPVAEAAPMAVEPKAEAPSLEASIAATRIATLGGPAVTIEETAAAKANAKPDASAVGKRVQRAKERLRAARRARVARQAAVQPPADPFAQPSITHTSR